MRARTIKPSFFINPELLALPQITRIFFAGLWTIADRMGRLEDRPEKHKFQVVPKPDDICDGEEMVAALAAKGLLVRYEAAGRKCIWIPSFMKHQKNTMHREEAESTLPPCPDESPEDRAEEDKRRARRSSNTRTTGARQTKNRRTTGARQRKNGRPAPSYSSAPDTSRLEENPYPLHEQKTDPKTTEAAPADLPPALNTEAFRRAWADWCRYSAERRQPVTPTTATHLLAQLAELGAARACEKIVRSISNGWKGVLFPEDKANGERVRAGDPPSDKYAGIGRTIGGPPGAADKYAGLVHQIGGAEPPAPTEEA